MGQEITLTSSEVDRINHFIDQMKRAGKQTKRDVSLEEAYLQGKGAEQAVARYLNDSFDIDCSPDYDVYDGYDSTDLKPYQVEVKTIPHYGSRVAIPVHKAEMILSDEPIVIVKSHPDHKFEVVGWCFKRDLSLTKQGEKPWTQKADNLCAHIDELRTNYRRLCLEMGANPSSRFNFSNS